MYPYIQDEPFRSTFELQTGVWGQRALEPNWFYAGIECTITLVETSLAIPIQSSFLQGYWYWHQMEWLISLFYVLSKCIIWNREMVYFKKKSILCSNSKLSPVLTVNRKLQVITQRHVRFHLYITSISDRVGEKESPWKENCLSHDFRQKPLCRPIYLSSTVFRWDAEHGISLKIV